MKQIARDKTTLTLNNLASNYTRDITDYDKGIHVRFEEIQITRLFGGLK
jgi:hypothetical protein